MSKLGKRTRTYRGFQIVHFEDYYKIKCSIQQSSLALYEQSGTSALWIGVDNPEPKVLHGDAKRLGVETDATCGWVPYPLPEEVSLSTRMHLERSQVIALISHLEKWVKTGSL
jgi:hypothetical protein